MVAVIQCIVIQKQSIKSINIISLEFNASVYNHCLNSTKKSMVYISMGEITFRYCFFPL